MDTSTTPLTESSSFCRTTLRYTPRLIFLAGTIRTSSLDKSIRLDTGYSLMRRIDCYLLDRGRVGAYCQRTLVGTPGASHFSQVIHRGPNPAFPHSARSLRVGGDRASFQVLRRAACQKRESPGGHHYVETDSGPACDCVGSDFGTGGSSADGTDADGVHVCKPVQCSAGKLGGVLGGYREDGRSHFGEADGERDDHRLVHV